MFEQFWSIYPRKMNKQVSKLQWNYVKDAEKILAMEALPNHVKYWQLNNSIIPFANTWLSNKRWEDELDLTESVVKKPQLPWYSSDELTLAKCRELGLNPYAGESFAQLRQRISAQISRQATV